MTAGLGWAVWRFFSAWAVWFFVWLGLIALTQLLWASFIGATVLAVGWFFVANMNDWKLGALFGPLIAFFLFLVFWLAGFELHRGSVVIR